MGFVQTAVTVNVPHALNEQAQHVAYILAETRARGQTVVEANATAEAQYVNEVHSMARVGARFYEECTPGYYNSEGDSANKSGFFSDMYGGGSIKFFRMLKDWRAQGEMTGLTTR